MALTPWLVELARTVPGLVRSYAPGGPMDARMRERVMLAVVDVDGCRWCAWVHGAWASYLGESVDDPDQVEEAVLDYARACALARRPVTPVGLPPAVASTARATVAQVGAASVVGRRADSLLLRVTGRAPLDLPTMVGEAATVALALPVAAPMVATAAAMRLATWLAPPMPEVVVEDDANLLVHVLARSVPAYLANAGVRLLALGAPVPPVIGVRSGRSSATVRLGRRRVLIEEGVAPDALIVLEGDVDQLLQVATGSLLRQVAGFRT